MARLKYVRPTDLSNERPQLPFNTLKVIESYKGPNYDGNFVLDLQAPGPLFAPCDLILIDYIKEYTGETIILESKKRVPYYDRSRARFTMLLRQNNIGGFIVKPSYQKGEYLGSSGVSHLYLEVSQGPFAGYDGHLYNTIRATKLFVVDGMEVYNDGQPVMGGERLVWSGITKQIPTHNKKGFHIGDRVFVEDGRVKDCYVKDGEWIYFIDKLGNYMGEDYLRFQNRWVKLMPSIIADLKEEEGKVKALVNGYWIDTENLQEVTYDRKSKNKLSSLPDHQGIGV